MVQIFYPKYTQLNTTDLLTPSSPLTPRDLDRKAKSLLQRLSADFACKNPKSSVTESIYITSWVSMNRNPPGIIQPWLISRAFDFILERQLEDGGWQSYRVTTGQLASDIDGIVNMMAALFALLVRRYHEPGAFENLRSRIARPDAALARMLRSWDVNSTDTIGFEFIVPVHLEMLEKYAMQYSFTGRLHLMKIYEHRTAKVKLEWLYGKEPLTLLYCLEAMIGKVVFDRLSHHKVLGTINCSPAATAAYLTNTTIWDADAEAFLCNATSSGCALDPFPTNISETTWASGCQVASQAWLTGMMLLSQSLMRLLEQWDQDLLPHLPENFLKNWVLPVHFGIMVETL
ncbi:MAG: hypothetical protein Q9213_004884 [Squamulea squamosa]